MPPRGDVAIVIPAKNEADRIRATVKAAAGIPGADLVVVVDDGSRDGTAAVAESAGAIVLRHSRSRGKGAALETGAEAVRLLERNDDSQRPYLLFLDGDLAESAGCAGALVAAGPARPGGHDDRGVHRPGAGRRARLRDRPVRGGHQAGHRLGAGPAAERPALPDPGRVRGGPAAGRGLGRGDRAHHRPAPAGLPGHRGRGADGAPGHRHRLAGPAAPGPPVRRRGPGAGRPDPRAQAARQALHRPRRRGRAADWTEESRGARHERPSDEGRRRL